MTEAQPRSEPSPCPPHIRLPTWRRRQRRGLMPDQRPITSRIESDGHAAAGIFDSQFGSSRR